MSRATRVRQADSPILPRLRLRRLPRLRTLGSLNGETAVRMSA